MSKNFIIDNSFQLIRTNPKLTSNIKVVIDSNYKLYLESFNSNKQLSDDKYKHYKITKDCFYEDKIPKFYDNLPINLAFDIKDDNDKNILFNNYNNQFDSIYFSGAKKIEDNKFFNEEFEYFAPLYIKKGNVPSNFIILRIDDIGVYTKKTLDYNLSSTNKDNFRDEIINKWKCINVFDLNYNTDFGYWLNKNFIDNDRFPIAPLEIDFKTDNYSMFHGIDYSTGVYTNKSLYLNDKFYYEQPHFKMEQFITESYKNNELIFPNIMNFKFLFDDTPASPNTLNKYSINRYLGFYTQSMNLVKRLNPHKQLILKTGCNIKLNTITLNNGVDYPFIETWNNKKQYYIYAKNDLHKIVQINNTTYKIISSENILISDITYDNDIKIDNNYIVGDKISIDSYVDRTGWHEMYADLYLIKIDNKYHVLEYNIVDGNVNYHIRTDYAIKCDEKSLNYWIVDEKYAVTGSTYGNSVLVDDNINKPLLFDVYKIKFSDIKDFDFDRVDTNFSDNEFDKRLEYIKTSEQKLYSTDYFDLDMNSNFKEYPNGNKFAGEKIVVSSEYIASDELYEIYKNNLTDIWKKNQYVAKWGYMGSNSNSDYPYKLNNSKKVGGDYNRTVNTFLSYPNVVEKTNDYFYRIGSILSEKTKTSYIDVTILSATTYYDYTYTITSAITTAYDEIQHYKTQTSSIENETYNELDNKMFNLEQYVLSNVDYFDYFFKNTRINDVGGLEQTTKYSLLVNGTKYNSSSTLFKGIKYNIRHIKDLIKNKYIESITVDNTINYNGYKFSVIFKTFDSIYDNNILGGDINSIHIFLNDKYKNILIIINNNLSSKLSDSFESLYNDDMNPELYTAHNFINAINNLNMPSFDNGEYISYHYIDINGKYGRTSPSGPLDINNMSGTTWNKNFPPFIIDVETSDILYTKKQSFKKSLIKGPKYNIYDKYKKDFYEIPYDKSFIKEPLSMKIDINETPLLPRSQKHGETLEYENSIHRYSGPYEPIFKDIELFENTKYDFFDSNVFQSTNYAKNINKYIGGEGYSKWEFTPEMIGSSDNRFCEVSFGGSAMSTIKSDTLLISDFGFNLPNAKINNIKVEIVCKANKDNRNNFILDENVQLITKYDDIYKPLGKNLANSGNTLLNNSYNITGYTLYSGYTWKTSIGNKPIYSIDFNVDITINDINKSDFGILLQIKKFSPANNFNNIAYVDSVKIDIYYTIDKIESGSHFINLERNYKFNTNLENFGMISELQFSKVNENENVLKLKDSTEDLSIYPMIDEFGLQYDKRFIFKSSWDSDFCIRTKNNIIDKNER